MAFQASSNLSEQIADYISHKIICMELQPGERILEVNIAEELKVSRSPIREALRILEQKRLVEIIPRKGARVTRLSRDFAVNLCDILSALLQLTARSCVINGTDKQLKAINKAAIESEKSALDNNPKKYYRAVLEFAISCLKATGNPLLEQMVAELLPNVRRILYASFAIKGENIQKNATIILDGNFAVQSRDPELAQQTIDIYMQKAREFALNFSEDMYNTSHQDEKCQV